MVVYEYVNYRGEGVFSAWYVSLQARARAALDRKLEDVITGDTPPGLFRGPVRFRGKTYPNTWKLTVNCGVAMRPLACWGPFANEEAWTLLVPVFEVGNKYDPDDFKKAEVRRQEVLSNRFGRRQVFRDESHYE